MFWAIGIIGILFIIFFWGMSMYNGFVKIRNRIEEAFATMDVYLKKRYDLVPNLVETVKGYASHERETLTKVVEARNQALTSSQGPIDQRVKNEGQLTEALRGLLAIAENYPNLKADTQFLDLQQQLQKLEEDIAQSRKYYNAVVKTFNTKCEVFPSNLIAAIFNFSRREYFQVEDEKERANVKVDFSH